MFILETILCYPVRDNAPYDTMQKQVVLNVSKANKFSINYYSHPCGWMWRVQCLVCLCVTSKSKETKNQKLDNLRQKVG